VFHRCGEPTETALHWQAGDEVMFFYWSRRNGGPQYCLGKVEAVNDGIAEVAFPDFRGVLRAAREINSGIRTRVSAADS
jgi:hypothetical protein